VKPMNVAPPAGMRGIVFVSSLLLLLVVTLIAVTMFRSFGIEERIAGNLREKHRALHAAESAQQYAEWWLTSGNNINLVAPCSAPLLNANQQQGAVCSNTLPSLVGDVTVVPWQVNGAEVGVQYRPPAMMVNATSAANTYYTAPRFYISLLGPAAGGQGNIYQVTAWGYGGTTDTVAVVESTYLVAAGVRDLGGL
jgi:type IV pilus assembly protein PilX